jgi:hypothetical protein
MQIKIEIDVKPEELRRFLGLPDVAGLQEDLINYLREKLGAASETFNPADILRANIDTITSSKAWRRIMDGASAREEAADDKPRPRRSRAARFEDDGD